VRPEADQQRHSAAGPDAAGDGYDPFPESELDRSVPERFEAQVRLHGSRVAVTCEGRAVTYEELDASANRVAHAILERLGEGEEPVPVLFGNDLPMVSAMFGALKAGKAYVPLDPGVPAERTAYIAGDAEARLVVTHSPNLTMAKGIAPAGAAVLNVDDLGASASDGAPGLSIGPDRLAYLMYTSGSTGRPKGVMLTHRNALCHGWGLGHFYRLGPGDRAAETGSLALTEFPLRLYPCLLNGATICTYDAKRRGLTGLVDWLRAEKVNVLAARSVFEGLLAGLKDGEVLEDLRHVTFGSDTVYRDHIVQARRFTRPDCSIAVSMGSTEAGNITRLRVPRDMELTERVMPVGRPLPGMEVFVVGGDGGILPPGEVGEMRVRSRCLSPGYWRRPELTARAFLPDPDGGDRRIYRTGDMGMLGPDGLFRHCGRADFQFKVRGYTIQAGDVEAALREIAAVTEAAATAQEQGGDTKRLVAHVTLRPGPRPTVSELRQAMSRKLPDYMVPSAFVILDEMPKTPSGKVNRKALPPPGTARPELATAFVAPRTPLEAALAAVWRDVLGLDEVGVDDAFLDLGGDSLLATRLVNRVRGELGVEVDLAEFFAAPAIAAQALIVLRALAGGLSPQAFSELLATSEGPPQADGSGTS
jgi:amino acid adenylation domain-containing protein